MIIVNTTLYTYLETLPMEDRVRDALYYGAFIHPYGLEPRVEYDKSMMPHYAALVWRDGRYGKEELLYEVVRVEDDLVIYATYNGEERVMEVRSLTTALDFANETKEWLVHAW